MTYIHKRLIDPKKFDKKSFRMKQISPDKKLIIGCPKGKWNNKKQLCKVGTKAQAILTRNNPKELTLIGKQIIAIEYYDPEKAIREGLSEPERIWRHDFTSEDAKIYGLPDGSILIKGKRKLWEWR